VILRITKLSGVDFQLD